MWLFSLFTVSFFVSQAIDCCRFCYYYYSEVKVDQEWKDVLRCKECKRNWSSIKVSTTSILELC